MYKVAFIAELLNCTEQSVRNLAWKGLLKIENHRISTQAILDYLINNRKWSTELNRDCLRKILDDADSMKIPRPAMPTSMQIEELIYKIKCLPYEEARRLIG